MTVLAGANFVVSLDGTNSPVAEGETLSVEATVENTGEIEETQTITLDVGPVGSTSTAVTLGDGEATNLTLSAGASSGDAGGYTATVSSGDDSASAGVTVLDGANFVVAIEGTNSPVAEGDTLSVDATIENTGAVEATQTITLDVGALGNDSTAVTLGGGESTSTTLSVTTAAGDAGVYTATVSSENDTDAVDFSVASDAEFVVNNTSATYDASAEAATVTYTVTNVGAVEGTVEVVLTATVDNRTATDAVTLGPAESGTDSLSTGIDTPGEQELLVSVGTDTASATVNPRPAEFSITAFETEVSGGTVSVNYTVENTGGVAATQDIVVTVNGRQTETTTATLTPGESTTAVFEGSVNDTTGPTVTVSTENDSESATLGVAVSIDGTESSLNVVADGTVTVVTVVENLGDDPLTEEVVLTVDGVERASAPVEIGGGEQARVNLTFVADPSDDGAVAVTSVGSTTASTALSVEQPAVLQVEPRSVQFGTVMPPGTATETIALTNGGDSELTLSRVELGTGAAFELTTGEVSAGEQTVLGPGESRTVTVEYAPEAAGRNSTYLYVESNAPTAPNRIVGITSGPVRTNVTVDEQNRTQVRTTIENATAGEQVSIDFPEPLDGGTYETESISITPATSGDIIVNVTTSNRSLPTTPETRAGFADNTTRVGNLSITANRPNEELQSVEFQATVDREQLSTWDTDPGNVSFYRFNNEVGVWEKRNTSVVELREDVAVIRAQAGGFSEWTAAAARPEFSIANTEIDVTSTTTEDDVTIQVFVENTGGTDGTYVAELLLNGETVDSQEAIIASGGEELFQFEQMLGEPGTYNVFVNSVFVADVDVTPPSGGNGTDDEGNDQTDDGADDNGTGDDDGGGDGFGSGFGVVTAVGALLAVLLAARAVRERRE